MALGSLPLTGVSRKIAPFSAACCAMSWLPTGAMVEKSKQTTPFLGGEERAFFAEVGFVHVPGFGHG